MERRVGGVDTQLLPGRRCQSGFSNMLGKRKKFRQQTPKEILEWLLSPLISNHQHLTFFVRFVKTPLSYVIVLGMVLGTVLEPNRSSNDSRNRPSNAVNTVPGELVLDDCDPDVGGVRGYLGRQQPRADVCPRDHGKSERAASTNVFDSSSAVHELRSMGRSTWSVGLHCFKSKADTTTKDRGLPTVATFCIYLFSHFSPPYRYIHNTGNRVYSLRFHHRHGHRHRRNHGPTGITNMRPRMTLRLGTGSSVVLSFRKHRLVFVLPTLSTHIYEPCHNLVLLLLLC